MPETYSYPEILKIINSCANNGSDAMALGKLFSVLSDRIPKEDKERNKETEEIEKKILSLISRTTNQERDISLDVDRWIDQLDGECNIMQMYVDCHLTTKAEKDAGKQKIHRAVKLGIMEHIGKRSGVYRKKDNTIEFMDFVNVDINNHLDVTLPLDIHKKTVFFPKAVIVLAGTTGMGKTSYALNFVRDNMFKHEGPIYYFNSEMSPQALNKKLSYFHFPIDAWKMKAIPGEIWDYTNIQDKIFPDAINVIDYLEPEGEKPYGIHGVISAIINKLNDGIAFITIQKKPGADLGAGGVYSAKASTLYLSMDFGCIKVIKNRFREEDPHPTANIMDFDIKPGVAFVTKGGWYSEEAKKKEDRQKVYAEFERSTVPEEIRKEGGFFK